MSHNLAFQYIKTVLAEDGPSTEDYLNEQLPQFGPELTARILRWARGNGSLTLDGNRYELTERGRR